MKFENTEVWGFKHAIRGMRNPMNSWGKSDSNYCDLHDEYDCSECTTNHNCPLDLGAEDRAYVIGKNDLHLVQKLILAGSEHRKAIRQIFVSVDITAPLYWWKEFDTYKVGTTANSTSSMHKLSTIPITMDCFETDDITKDLLWDAQSDCSVEDNIMPFLENLRIMYIQTKDKRYWKELIRWLPESWLQTRTVTMNYENLRNMYFQRRNHKLTEWSESFINWIKILPYSEELIMYEGE